ncbi:MAG: signal peptidase II [Sedimentisphaerales bacterium]|nr:signal peptidase II [Sedimentisphaerales bacterium]
MTAAETNNCPQKRFWESLNKQISPSKAHLLFWTVFIIGLVSDLWTKSAVFNWLGERIPHKYDVIHGFFRLVLVENSGAAWGIAAGKTVPLIMISIIAMIVVFGVFLCAKKPRRMVVFSLALLLAGIIGNLYDRVFNDGRVRDFLDFYYKDWHFPAFNIADSMLTISVFLLILVTLFGHEPKDTIQQSPSDSAGETEPRP